MADGRGKVKSAVNNNAAVLIGQGDNIENNISLQTHIQCNAASNTYSSDSCFHSESDDITYHAAFELGGVICDQEDKGCLGSVESERLKNNSSRHLPRLVFLDSDENITKKEDSLLLCDSTHSNCKKRSASDVVVNSGLSFAEKSLVYENKDFKYTHDNTNRLLESHNSHVSLHSSDSELITDHIMPSEQEVTNVGEEDFEQFLLQNTVDDAADLKDWHCHAATVKIPPDKVARNQLIAVSVLCFLFMVGEAIGGMLSNSLALFTDVLHLGSDLISFLISLLSMYLAKKHATRTMSFGYHRAEVLGALFSVFIIWSVTGVLVYVAIERIVHEHYKDVKPDEMLITAVLGVVFNIVMGLVLHSEICCGKSRSRPSFGHGHSHGHGHGHSHQNNSSHQNDNGFQSMRNSRRSSKEESRRGDYEPLLPDEENLQMAEEGELTPDLKVSDISNKQHPKNINVRAAFIHVLGDIIQSMGVLLASIIIKLKPEDKYRLADPICTFLFSVLVLLTTVNVLRDTLRIIMEGVPRDTNYFSIKQSLQKITGVKAVHGLTVWCLTLEKNALAVHLAIDKTVSHQKVLFEASKVLKDHYNLLHTTIQVEEYKSDIMAKCMSCQELKK